MSQQRLLPKLHNTKKVCLHHKITLQPPFLKLMTDNSFKEILTMSSNLWQGLPWLECFLQRVLSKKACQDYLNPNRLTQEAYSLGTKCKMTSPYPSSRYNNNTCRHLWRRLIIVRTFQLPTSLWVGGMLRKLRLWMAHQIEKKEIMHRELWGTPILTILFYNSGTVCSPKTYHTIPQSKKWITTTNLNLKIITNWTNIDL